MSGEHQTVGLAIICRDEIDTLPHLLDSVEGCFDEFVAVDTGSKDGTIELLQQRGQSVAPSFQLLHFEWCDDFGAARQYAQQHQTTTFQVWSDADDVIRGADKLRMLANTAPPELHGFIAGYQYAFDGQGNCITYLKRERIVRRGCGEWMGRVHEAQVLRGPVQWTDEVEWIHQKPPGGPSRRNLKILEAWVKDEPENPRIVGYCGTERAVLGHHKKAVSYFRRYLKLKSGWDEEKAQIHRKLGICLLQLGKPDEAISTALEAMQLLPNWTDSYLTLAEAYHQTHEWSKCAYWAQETLRMGCPDTMLIVNPIEYTFTPRVLLSSALGAMGQYNEAIQVAEEAMKIVRGHEALEDAYQRWRAIRKRETTAASWLGMAEVLVNHDEQLKALEVLESAPHFCVDHPQIVAMRSHVRQRVKPLLDPSGTASHYETGGSKPEDFIADDKVDEIAGSLPRTDFLIHGLYEMDAA